MQDIIDTQNCDYPNTLYCITHTAERKDLKRKYLDFYLQSRFFVSIINEYIYRARINSNIVRYAYIEKPSLSAQFFLGGSQYQL